MIGQSGIGLTFIGGWLFQLVQAVVTPETGPATQIKIYSYPVSEIRSAVGIDSVRILTSENYEICIHNPPSPSVKVAIESVLPNVTIRKLELSEIKVKV